MKERGKFTTDWTNDEVIQIGDIEIRFNCIKSNKAERPKISVTVLAPKDMPIKRVKREVEG